MHRINLNIHTNILRFAWCFAFLGYFATLGGCIAKSTAKERYDIKVGDVAGHDKGGNEQRFNIVITRVEGSSPWLIVARNCPGFIGCFLRSVRKECDGQR